MKVKFEYFILIVVIAALAVYLSTRGTDRTMYELPEIPTVAAKDFTRIEITRQGAALVLEKKDDAWQIQPQGFPVDPGRIEAMLSTIAGLKTTALASEAEDYRRYELDEEGKIGIKAWTGGDLKREFEIGKPAPSFRHTFVRLGGDPRVFHARDNFRNKFDLDEAALQDKTILKLDTAAINTIDIETPEGSAQFNRQSEPDKDNPAEKKPSVWQRDNGQTADRAAIEKLLGRAANVKCQQFIDGLAKQDLQDPIYTLVLKTTGRHSLSIFKRRQADAESYPATSSASAFPFALDAEQAEQIMQRPEDLMPKAENGNEEKQS